MTGGCCLTPDQVQEAFLASPPLIAQQILDLSVKHPIWLSDLWSLEEWPRGNGTLLEQLVFRGAMPQIERGFERWRKIQNISGCNPCSGPDCNYNWNFFGGHGFERKLTELMSQDFRSPDYCINEIQTTAHFKEVFAKIVENLYRQTAFYKEFNIGLNFLTMLAKKYVVDSGGAKPNPANPYVYRNIGTARLSALNIEMLEFFYEAIRRLPDAIPYDTVDGAPLYSLLASPQLLSRLYRDDSNLRQDVRFSGLANDLVTKYNFMSTIRGMFIAAPILYPRRFKIVDGEPVEILPFVNNVPAEVGVYTYLNPEYEAATHEEIILHGKYPFKVFYYPTETSLGDNTSFGPEFSFMNSWAWVNPSTPSDPFRRVGFFATSAKIGLSQQFSEGIYGILVERPSTALMAIYTPNPVCPVDPPVCDNTVPDVGCPCPAVLSITADPFTASTYNISLATAVDGDPDDPIVFELDNGTTITGTLEQISSDGKTVQVSFTTDLPDGICTAIINVSCVDNAQCSALVQSACDCRSNQTDQIKLTLSNAIRATVDDLIIAYFGDCTIAELKIVSVDGANLEYTVEYAPGYGPTDDPTGEGSTGLSADMVCDRGGITKVCVPPATDATCPACGVDVTPCAEY